MANSTKEQRKHWNDANISQLLTNEVSLERVLAEIEKCEIVCANCHRLRTVHRRE